MAKYDANGKAETNKHGGRPSIMTQEILDKLRQAFLIGATNEEACGFAGIGVKTLYNYFEKEPEFVQQVADWKNDPILEAKNTIVKNIKRDTNVAKWYLERRAKAEYGNNVDITTDGEKLSPILVKFIDEPKDN